MSNCWTPGRAERVSLLGSSVKGWESDGVCDGCMCFGEEVRQERNKEDRSCE